MFTLPKPMLMRQPGPNSLRAMMRYPFEMVATIMMSPWASLFLTNIRSRLKLRTQYSGIGTFEWAFTMLERVCKIMGLIEDDHNFVILTEVCDLDTRCLQVLSTYDGETTTHQPCMYGDVMARLCGKAQARLRNVRWPSAEEHKCDNLKTVHIAMTAMRETKGHLE